VTKVQTYAEEKRLTPGGVYLQAKESGGEAGEGIEGQEAWHGQAVYLKEIPGKNMVPCCT